MSQEDPLNELRSEVETVAPWPWPFSRADLAAGLRRYLSDATLWVESVEPLKLAHQRPSIGRLRGALVIYSSKAGGGSCRVVVKEPRGTTRTGLAGAGRREVGVYRYLASEIPVRSPRLIAASEAGDWIVLEEFQTERGASKWTQVDYRKAVHSLSELHDRFWGLSEDLANFPWLSRPLDADFEIHVMAAANALERIADHGRLASWPERVHTMAHLILHAEQVIAPLKQEPATLLHGDYWPGNIAVLDDGQQVVYDWQLAAVGPPILDVVAFVLKSEWWFGPLPLGRDQIVEEYRQLLAEISGQRWEDESWSELWDHALMWRFLQEWLDLMAISPTTLLEARSEQLEQLWFEPLAKAVSSRLL